MTATGGANGGAGIGGSGGDWGGAGGAGGSITISGGTVTATGYRGGAGIGGGDFVGAGGSITINGGVVTATGNGGSAGIGGSDGAASGDILIYGEATVVTATNGGSGAQDIGEGGLGGGVGGHVFVALVQGNLLDNTPAEIGNPVLFTADPSSTGTVKATLPAPFDAAPFGTPPIDLLTGLDPAPNGKTLSIITTFTTENIDFQLSGYFLNLPTLPLTGDDLNAPGATVPFGGLPTPALTVSSSANPSVTGDSVTFAVDISGGAAPTGNIVLCQDATTTNASCAGGTTLCTVLAEGTPPLACPPKTFATAGTYQITAYYEGDTNNNSATSAALAQVVNAPLPQTITFTSTAPTNPVVGDTYQVSATSTDTASGTPTGLPVTLTIDAASTSGCTIDTTATPAVVTFTGPAGTCIIDADQAGDTTYAAATQVQQTISVVNGGGGGTTSQTVAFTSTAPTNPVVGDTYQVSATSTDTASGTPTGLAVDLAIDVASTSGCTIDTTATLAVVTFTAPTGSCIIDADQGGDATYAAATQVQQTINVVSGGGPIPQTIAFTSTAPVGPAVGDTYTVIAIGGASGNPVVFSIDATSTAGACTLTGSVVTFNVAGATCVIDANQAGDTTYAPAPQKQQFIQVGSPTPPPPPPPPPPPLTPQEITGDWYNPAYDGSGFNITQTSQGLLLFYYGWDSGGNRLWLISDIGPKQIVPGTAVTLNMNETSGGSFLVPALPKTLTPWGKLTIIFGANGTSTTANLVGKDGSVSFSLQKLASEVDAPSVTGDWYDPAYTGSGFNMLATSKGLIFFYYGWDNEGKRLWLISDVTAAQITAGSSVTMNMNVANNTMNDASFLKPADPITSLSHWGTLKLDFSSCTQATGALTSADGSNTVTYDNLMMIVGVMDMPPGC
ncbi:MAG: Ig-like domain-containing protein [Rhodanobacter sp.]|nr:Ig-like domain-containing protein [Rhodanobacter sp.]